MMEQDLFIGVAITPDLEEAMDTCDSVSRAFFTDPEYLSTYEVEGQRYLGKFVESGHLIYTFEDVAQNILSLIARIAPSLEYRRADLRVFSRVHLPTA